MKKSNIYGIIGSTVSCIILFLLLWLVVMPTIAPKPPDDEGIMVSFGDNIDGSGMNDMPAEEPTPPAAQPVAVVKPVKQDFVTQTDNSLIIAEQKKKDKDRKEKEAVENQRIETANRAAADRKRKEQAAIDKANTMNGMFGNNNSTGSGTGTGDTRQGNPAGKGSSGGNSYSINGRSLTGLLVSPSYDRDVEGKITVNIRVNENGNVVSANIGSPTTISDAETRNAATSAARNTHFTSGKGVSSGSITYNFNLK